MKDILSLRFPDKSDEEIKTIIMQEVSNRFQDNTNITIDDQHISLREIDNLIIKESPIISGSGTLYQRQDQIENDRAGMIKTFAIQRKKEKNIMFKHTNDEDQTIHNLHDNNQKSWKIMTNSYYGVLNESHSQFYDEHSGRSTTMSSVDAITSAINFFEKFIANNIFFRDLDEIYQYIININNQDTNLYDTKIKLKFKEKDKITLNFVSNYLNNFLDDHNSDTLNKISIFLSNIDTDKLFWIYYKNNLKELFKDTNIVDDHLINIINRSDFNDANTPPDEIKDELNNISEVLNIWVLYNYQDYNRMYNVTNRKRKAVLLTDTDSTFLYLDPIIQTLKDLHSDKIDESDQDKIIGTVNVIMNLITQATKKMIYKFVKENGIPDSHSDLLSMKNEFLSSKVMLTNQKKNYAQVIILQEGNKFDTPDLDIKGMQIKKTTTNKEVRKIITELLRKDVLESNTIDYAKILKKYKDLEKHIYKSLMAGELTFTIPRKVNNADSYKSPYSIDSYKGSFIWNKLYPEKPIVPPTKIQIIKTDITTWSDVSSKITDPEELEKFKSLFRNKDLMGTRGLNSIAIGENEEEIPAELRKFIDVKLMVSTHMKNVMQLLESIGIQVIDASGRQFPSNTINI